ncbi:polysaccharide deacetylase family protein [Gracilibacillus massiliensis]|uniref:polysaccharide deacetylase family protein n=1 Tax=Gracilibacillus massiliensis TaxID=1564956 RepID=UPI00071C53A4|nr:polysaccharide deacetylase family protein [Gracilibacillus massiliensis]
MIKKNLFNICFTLVFFGLFSFIIFSYYEDIARALYNHDVFPTDETFEIEACQQWTNSTRNFDMAPDNKAENVTVLMYHRIIEDEEIDDIHLEEDGELVSTVLLKSQFEEQMQLLKKEGYTTLTLKELEQYINNDLDVPKKSLVLTFDDGFKDNAMEVAPILRKLDFNAVSFVITAAVHKYDYPFKAGEFQYFSVDDIHNSCDVFEFESHTYNFHKRMEDNTPYLTGKSDEKVKEDLENSLFNLDGKRQAFASPYGAYDEENIQLFKDLGFSMAFTVNPDVVYPGTPMYEIPRKEVFPDDTMEDFKEKIGLH